MFLSFLPWNFIHLSIHPSIHPSSSQEERLLVFVFNWNSQFIHASIHLPNHLSNGSWEEFSCVLHVILFIYLFVRSLTHFFRSGNHYLKISVTRGALPQLCPVSVFFFLLQLIVRHLTWSCCRWAVIRQCAVWRAQPVCNPLECGSTSLPCKRIHHTHRESEPFKVFLWFTNTLPAVTAHMFASPRELMMMIMKTW